MTRQPDLRNAVIPHAPRRDKKYPLQSMDWLLVAGTLLLLYEAGQSAVNGILHVVGGDLIDG
jgi:hypothetical protein